MTATHHEPARHSKPRDRTPRTGLLAFLVLALAAAGAGFVVRADAEHPPTAAATPTGPTIAPAAYVLSAEATAEVRAARFRISTTRAPTSAVLTLDAPGKAASRTVPVDLASPSTEVVVRGLAAGRTTWTIAAKGAPVVRGTLRIPATGQAPSSPLDPDSATLRPGSDTPSADPAPPSGTSSGTSGSTTGGRTEPKPAPAPSQEPEPPAPSSPDPTPTPTPRPTGPSSPYDPDDD